MYPSVSGSFIFSELLPSSVSKILSFGKVRASWAEVGNDTSPYQMSLNYALYPHPVGGVSSGQISNSTVPNRDLKPTRTRSWEVGTELYFLNKRIVLDFTYYSQTSRDQIRHVNTSISTGYSTALLNSGVLTNKGIEIKLNTIPVKTKNWQWDLGFNFARNSNKVHSLGESQMYEVENAEWVGAAGVRVMAVVGEELGTIMGKDYKRNENGDIIVDPTTGIPSVSDNYTALGNAHWKFTGGMYTNVRFKNWNLSAIFDIKVGADLYTSTMRGTYSSGRSKKTLKGRDGWYQSEEGRLAAGLETAAWNPTGGYLVDGVVQVKNDDGTISWAPNTRYCNPESYWNFISNNIPQFFVLDNSYVKIREMTLSYSFPRRMIGKALDGLTLSFVARNPLIIFKNVPNIDPDSNYNNGNGKGIEYGSLPSRRSFGFNINLKF
ncbi:TonB-dependent receptor [Alistipes finegoldii]|nr:TonB-dependent receptor [Alistipes finegoldii]MCB6683014.1 TonB-dependent receptor [Alistipes finegoldii]